jgi:drug/metabolite transporter (DMT)-like permease
VLVPVLVGVAQGDDLSPVQVAGVVVAVAGVVLAGGPHLREFRTGGHRPVLWALLAALGLGAALTALAYGSESSSVSTLLVQRLFYVLVPLAVVLATRVPRVPRARHVVPLGTIGAGDMTANGLFAVASRSGPLAVIAVVSALYPVATVLLARQIQHERLERIQVIGVVAALVGVAATVAG